MSCVFSSIELIWLFSVFLEKNWLGVGEKVKTRLWEGKGVVVDVNIEVIGKNMLGNLWMKIRDEI